MSREWNEELVLDISSDGYNNAFAYRLDDFNIPTNIRRLEYPVRFNCHDGQGFCERMPVKLFNDYQVVNEEYFENIDGYLTIPKEKFYEEFPNKNIYLHGGFLLQEFFIKYIREIRSIFTLRRESDYVNDFLRNKPEIAVGVHVRRKGFVVNGLCDTMDFFRAAIEIYRKKYKGHRVTFFVFSDDLGLAIEELGESEDIKYVHADNGFRGDIEEFLCLVNCDKYILSRKSSYGRMAEILNSSSDKETLLFGKGEGNDRWKYITEEEVIKYNKTYVDKQCSMPRRASEENYITLLDSRFDRMKAYYNNKDYLMARHMGLVLEAEMLNSLEFHKLYYSVLKHLSLYEARVEETSCNKMEEKEKNALYYSSLSAIYSCIFEQVNNCRDFAAQNGE